MSQNYEQYLVPSIFGPWAENLLELVEPKPGEQCSISPAAPEYSLGSLPNGLERVAGSSALI